MTYEPSKEAAEQRGAEREREEILKLARQGTTYVLPPTWATTKEVGPSMTQFRDFTLDEFIAAIRARAETEKDAK